MQIKNLSTYNYGFNFGTKIFRNINLIKNAVIIFIVIASFTSILCINNVLGHTKDSNVFVADFKTDINMISETARILEIERAAGKNKVISQFGTDGEIINVSEITPDLRRALVKIIDINKDGKISNEEILEAGIMKLNQDVFKKELKKYQFNLVSADHNLKKFIVITNGKHAGTVLYNGNIKFIDSENKQYFGLELFN